MAESDQPSMLSEPTDLETATVQTSGKGAVPHEPAAEHRDVPEAEQRLGRYRLQRVLGIGGMGIVYAAYDPDLDRHVAIKLLRADKHSSKAHQRLLREARAMAKLSHPNVISVYEIATAGERTFVVMELISGVSLAEWLRGTEPSSASRPSSAAESDSAATASIEARARSQPLPETEPIARTRPTRPWREVLSVFLRAGRGLAAAHEAGLIHRDFKPANVLLGKDGRILVTDFGLARRDDTLIDGDEPADAAMQPELDLTRTGAIMGTPIYMAPEQYRGERGDARTDQYNFCAALYHALYREQPFAGKTLLTLQEAVLSGKLAPEPPGSPVPRRLRRVLLRGMAPDPKDRFASLHELLSALERAGAPWQRPAVLAVAAACVLAAVIGGVILSAEHPAPSAASVRAIELPQDPVLRAKYDALSRELDEIERRWRLGYKSEAHERAQAVLKEARAADFRPLIVRALLEETRSLHMAELTPQTITRLEEAAVVSEGIGDSKLRALILTEIARLTYLVHQDPNARRIAIQRAMLAVDAYPDDISLQYRAAFLRTLLAFLDGRMADLEALLVRAAELADKQGDIFEANEIKLNLANILVQNNGTRARTVIRDVIETARSRSMTSQINPELSYEWLQRSASFLDMLGDHKEAANLRRDIAELTKGAERSTEAGQGRTVSGRVRRTGDEEVTVALGKALAQREGAVMLDDNFQVRIITAEPSGSFVFEDASPELLFLVAYSAHGRTYPMRIEPGSDVRDIELTLAPTGSIRGQLALSLGSNESVDLHIAPASKDFGLYTLIVRPDAQGRFQASNIAPGRYVLMAMFVTPTAQEYVPLAVLDVTTAAPAPLQLTAQEGPSELVIQVKSSLFGGQTRPALVFVLPGAFSGTRYGEALTWVFANLQGARAAMLLPENWSDASASPTKKLRHRFRGMIPGPTTVCALEYTNITTETDLGLAGTEIHRHADQFEVACTPVTIPPSGAIEATVESAPLRRISR